MPNPVRTLKSTRGLTDRQKTLVKRIKRQGLTPKIYRRKSSPSRVSVHNPFLDIIRKAKKGDMSTTKRYPHARDTVRQRRLNKPTARKQSKRKSRILPSLKGLFNP